jgi:hypothetical protein
MSAVSAPPAAPEIHLGQAMDNLTKLLRDADPLTLSQEDAELSPADAQQMRRAVLAEARQSPAASPVWRRPLALAAAVILIVGLVGISGDRRSVPVPVGPEPTDKGPLSAFSNGSDDDARRQLQFSTPGGTRIIWVFDQNLRLQEPMP